MKRLAAAALIAVLLASAAEARPANRPAARGLAYAKAHCAACHGITANAPSPNPEAPPWDAVVNKPGLTRTTLATFLRDSHSYPDAMNFRIDPSRVDDLAAYMVTLRRKGFRPPA